MITGVTLWTVEYRLINGWETLNRSKISERVYARKHERLISRSEYIFDIIVTLFVRALPFTWEGETVVVLQRGGAVGGGVGALAEVVDDDDDGGAGLLTLGVLSFSFSLPCEGL